MVSELIKKHRFLITVLILLCLITSNLDDGDASKLLVCLRQKLRFKFTFTSFFFCLFVFPKESALTKRQVFIGNQLQLTFISIAEYSLKRCPSTLFDTLYTTRVNMCVNTVYNGDKQEDAKTKGGELDSKQ